jgi:hypothetical protein
METAAPAPLVKEPGTARIVGASVIGLLALLLISAGVAGLWARTASSDHGWITSGSHRYAANGNAIVSGSLDVDGVPDWLVAKVRVSATSEDRQPIFVGIARRADVDRYLAGVAHATVEDVNFDPFSASYSSTPGTVVPARPAAQTFWAESKVGTGTQKVSWKIRDGNWRVVVMNADGSPRVAADAKVGATIRGALAIVISVLAAGLLLAGLAVALVLTGRRRS